MKRKFSIAWKASKRPGKQRKYLAKAPLHLRKKFLSVNLSKELRKKYEMKNITAKKGDIIKIMRGKFKKKQGKILEIKYKTGKIYIEGINAKKREGSSVNVPLKASNLQIIELNMEGKRKIKKAQAKTKGEEKEMPKSIVKEEKELALNSKKNKENKK
jgi:large subunit ribosomal protein L24